MLYVVFVAWGLLHLACFVLISIFIMSISFFISEKLQIYYRCWKNRKYMQRCQRNYELRLQEERRRELHRKEKEKYPLFFLKDGIV